MGGQSGRPKWEAKVGGCGRPWEAEVGGHGRPWEAKVGGCGRLWEAVGGRGRPWEALIGSDRSHEKMWEAEFGLPRPPTLVGGRAPLIGSVI